MSDQPQHSNSAATQDWEARAVFRETYLHLYSQADLRAAYRRVGVALYEQALAYEETYKPRGEVPVKADLRAAARDLRQLEGYMRHLGIEPSGFEDPELPRIFLLTLEVADQLGLQASRIEAVLGAPVDAEP